MGWFTNWRRGRAVRSRAIFCFHDGVKERAGDPLGIYRALRALPDFDWEDDTKGVDRGDEESIARTLAALRHPTTFHAKPFDAETLTGLTDGETLNLLSQFVWYLDSLKKNGSGPPTLPESTASEPSSGPMNLNPITKSESDSGSTSTVPSSAAPEASLSGSVPPLVEASP